MEKVYQALDNFLNDLDKDKDVLIIKKLSKEIISNKEITELIKKYNKLSLNNPNNIELINIKKQLFNNVLYKEYMTAENNLSYFLISFNQKIAALLDTKQCKQ